MADSREVGPVSHVATTPAHDAQAESPAYCQAYLERRWAEGCKIGRLLLPEIQRLGYTGSVSHLERLLTQWRAAGSRSLVVTPASADSLPLAIDAATGQLISPIIASALCMKPTSLLTPRQVAKIQALKAESPEFVAMRQFVMRFRGIMRSGDLDKLMTWIDDVRRSGLHAMQRFARSLLHDLDAVRNAMIEPWSRRPDQSFENLQAGYVWARRRRTPPSPNDSASPP